MSRASIQQQQRVFPQQQVVSAGGLAGGSHGLLLSNNNNGSTSRQYTSVSPQNGSKTHRHTESTQHFDDAADLFPSFNCESGDLGDMLAREMGDGGLGRESSQRYPAWGDVSLSDMDMVPQCMPIGLMTNNTTLGGGGGGVQMGNQHGGKEHHGVNGMPTSYNNSMMMPNMMMPSMVPSMQQVQMQQRNGMMQHQVRDNNNGSNQFGYYCSKDQQQQQQYPQVPFPMQWYVNGPMMPYQCFATPMYFAAQAPPGVVPSSDSDSGQGTHFCSRRAMPQASSSSSKSSAKRMACVERYRRKKAKRSFTKHIRYQMRKDNADKRVRVKGRFARTAHEQALNSNK